MMTSPELLSACAETYDAVAPQPADRSALSAVVDFLADTLRSPRCRYCGQAPVVARGDLCLSCARITTCQRCGAHTEDAFDDGGLEYLHCDRCGAQWSIEPSLDDNYAWEDDGA